jgi:plasmid segregation protein ParM
MGFCLLTSCLALTKAVKQLGLACNHAALRVGEFGWPSGVNNRKFYIGVTGLRQCQAESFTGQTRNRIETDQHDALLVGAWISANKIIETNGLHPPQTLTLVLGLPAFHYIEQRSALRARVKALIEPLLLADQTQRVFIESQFRVPLLFISVDSNGNPTDSAGNNEAWGVTEIGHFTTDFTFHDQGQEVDRAASIG